jgi:hypothetical protein
MLLSHSIETGYNQNMQTQKPPKPEKFNFEILKAQATSEDREVRKKIFKDYFERFEEFPSYLFDNTAKIDSRLSETIQDLTNDPETTKAMQKGIVTLMLRLPSA